MVLIRPHIAVLLFAALLVAQLFRPASTQVTGILSKTAGLLVMGAAAWFLATQSAELLGTDDISWQGVTDSIDMAGGRTNEQGGSEFEPVTVRVPGGFPAAAVTVLFRPVPVGGAQRPDGGPEPGGALPPGADRRVLARLRRLPGVLRRHPYVLFALVYTASFIVAFSGFANFGILARQRVLMLPLFFVLLALPVTRPGVEPPDGEVGGDGVQGEDLEEVAVDGGGRETLTASDRGRAATGPRARLKAGLAGVRRANPAEGVTLLIYHRVGGGSADELDLPTSAFARQLGLLEGHRVESLDTALDRLDRGDTSPSVVLTFDDGFEDLYRNAWPQLRQRRLPFTVYLASAFVSRPMVWEGSTARGAAGQGMSWAQLAEMVDSGLCTVGNHTHGHVRPEALAGGDLDACTQAVERNLGVTPAHFTYPWGIPVPRMEPALRARFRSASSGQLGRNLPETDRMRLKRVPVRQSDPDAFFAAKLVGGLGPERTYAGLVRVAKAVGLRG